MAVRQGQSPRARPHRSTALYLIIAFGMAWALWFVAWLAYRKLLGLPLFPLLVVGSFGPFTGAAAATYAGGGLRRSARFFARAFNPRMGWPVFLASFLLMPLMAVAVAYASAGLAHRPPHFTMSWADLPLTYVVLFVLGGTLAEEYGWSLLSDKLDRVLPLVRSTLCLGAIWAVWHLPLFFIVEPGAIQGYTPFPIFFLQTVAMRFLFAWAYHRGGYNILSNMLFHTGVNLAFSITPIAPAPGDFSTGRLWMFTGLTVVAAAAFWGLAPPRASRPPPEV